jgi:hypothetical protein
MIVYKYNHVFDHIEKILLEHYNDRPEYDKVVVAMGYNVLKNFDFLRKEYPGHKIIAYQLEHLVNKSPWVSKGARRVLAGADEIWDYDKDNIIWMRKNYKLNAKFKPLMYAESLKILPPVVENKCDIDVLFYGYMHPRRAQLILKIQHDFGGKHKIFDLYGVWGKELDEYITRSKIILNISSETIARQEQPRIFYPVINGRCVLSEKHIVNYFGDSIVECPYKDIPDKIKEMLKNGTWLDVAYQSSERYKKVSEKYKKHL